MSISKTWVSQPENIARVLELYRDRGLMTLQEIAITLQTTFHNVSHVVKMNMPEQEKKALAALRYSYSKMGDNNPMTGKAGAQHHNWVGEVDDQKGYLTIMHNGKRQFVHRVKMAQALWLTELPEYFHVHHIDGNPMNNELDNLALVTPSGHKTIHSLQVQDSKSLQLKKLTLRDAFLSMT
jgi:hypothetical protein